jgi:hypothetical protein
MDGDDVWVLQALEGTDFEPEAPHVFPARDRQDCFDGYLFPSLLVVGAVDDSHAAPAKFILDEVTSSQALTRR